MSVPDISSLYVFTAEKGGMAGFDKDLQQQVIREMSKNSKHMEYAKQMDAKVDAQVLFATYSSSAIIKDS
jgi:hypothetical protein